MLELQSVAKTYANGARALHDISLTIETSAIFAIVGGSGCGKSTLLRLVAGLDRPSSGTIRLDGTTITAPNEAVGLVFQEPRLLPWLTVEQNVGFGLAEIPAAERRHRVAATLGRVGLEAYARRWPRELSGGQAQRVALARALVAEPRVLLLDEPFSALDAFIRADLQDHLFALWSDTRPTMVLVTHDIEEALVLADRVMVMKAHPGRSAGIMPVTLPRPRDRLSEAFDTAKRQLLAALGRAGTHHAGEELFPMAAI
jgi:sulfonate transport system ATP-binding protein